MATITSVRARRIGVILTLVWMLISLGWSWFLLRQSHTRATQADLARRTLRIQKELDGLFPDDVPLTEQNAYRFVDVSDRLDVERGHDAQISYAMLWGPTGVAVAHTDRDWRGRTLPTEYQTPEKKETVGFVSRDTVPFSRSIQNVLEVTVPIGPVNAPTGYLSVGYSRDLLDADFFITQRPLMIYSGSFTLLGMEVLILGLRLAVHRIEQARAELEQNARARTSLLTERGMLASVLAHEVRSPLTALRFNLHSLRNYIMTESSTDRQVELTDRCEREIRRLDLMLNDFLSRTQIIAPIMPTPANRVVNEALDFLRPALEQKHIRTITHLDAANPLVAVNPDELRQVLLNLAANAQDAMPKGGTLTVSTVLDPEAANVTLLFRDSGVGIPPELHTRIFEPFFTTKANGSGLGLALVRRVISGAGGTIFCESAPGEGTTFRIVLPQASDETPPAPRMEEPPDIVIDHTVAENPGHTVPADQAPKQ